mgnify:CR=1 FL=1
MLLDWEKEMTPEMFDPQFQEIIEKIGVENFLHIVEFFGGGAVYIPKKERITAVARNERIRSEFNGYNHKELARKYRLSTRSIRDIVKEA